MQTYGKKTLIQRLERFVGGLTPKKGWIEIKPSILLSIYDRDEEEA